jgi:hypothetical protein
LISFLAARLMPVRSFNRRIVRRSPPRPAVASSHA